MESIEKPKWSSEGDPEKLRSAQERAKAIREGQQVPGKKANPLAGNPAELKRRRQALAKLYPPKATERLISGKNRDEEAA